MEANTFLSAIKNKYISFLEVALFLTQSMYTSMYIHTTDARLST